MNRVFVLRTTWLTDQIVEMLKRLLGALGLELQLVEPDELDEVVAACVPEDVLLVMIDRLLDEDAPGCEAIVRVAGSGARVVGVWPPNHVGGDVPAILQRRAAGLVTCDAKGLGELLRSPGESVWLKPDGGSRADQPLKRGGC